MIESLLVGSPWKFPMMGDNAEQLKAKTKEWLAANAELKGLIVDVTHMG